MSMSTIVIFGGLLLVAGAGVVLGAFGHSIAVGRRSSMLDDWEAELEGRELHLTLEPPATRAPRAVGTSTVMPRDPNPNAPTRAREDDAPELGPTRRQRAYRFAADAYPTMKHAARTLNDPLPSILLPGRPQDMRPLADALTGNAPHVGRHAANPGDWT